MNYKAALATERALILAKKAMDRYQPMISQGLICPTDGSMKLAQDAIEEALREINCTTEARMRQEVKEREVLEKVYGMAYPEMGVSYSHRDHAVSLVPSPYLYDPYNSDKDSSTLAQRLKLTFMFSSQRVWVVVRTKTGSETILERICQEYEHLHNLNQREMQRQMILEAAMVLVRRKEAGEEIDLKVRTFEDPAMDQLLSCSTDYYYLSTITENKDHLHEWLRRRSQEIEGVLGK